ncbi:hypothetical protein GCM10027040_06840 [Halomonas shantousis]
MSEEHNPTAGHEPRDVPARIPVLFILFMAIFLPLVLLALWGLMSTVWRELPGPPNPFAGEPANVSKAPRLQTSPEVDLATFNERVEARLHGVGWSDREAGRVHMPVEQAMQLLAERGLPEQGPLASERASLTEPPLSKGVNAATPDRVNVSAAQAVVGAEDRTEPGDRQEAGNE